ncbi:hypothetical protein [Streptomyces sp. NBC_00057]|uniref:hypothetical protein n=1 Tax=Streptomyces sp. NBC_00057 TaxID=2975634 RepID=UPI003248ECC8
MFNHIGERNPNRTVPCLSELTRHLWEGERQKGGYHHYDGRIPIIATDLQNLREHGPAGPAFWRFGRKERQPLLDAIGNPRRDTALARRRQAAREEQRNREARGAAAREARRPVRDFRNGSR